MGGVRVPAQPPVKVAMSPRVACASSSPPPCSPHPGDPPEHLSSGTLAPFLHQKATHLPPHTHSLRALLGAHLQLSIFDLRARETRAYRAVTGVTHIFMCCRRFAQP